MGLLDRILGPIRKWRKKSPPPVARGHNGVLIVKGMWVRNFTDPHMAPVEVVAVIPATNSLKLKWSDGVVDVFPASHFVVVRRSTPRKR